jgi:hypothetical protein
MNSTFFNHEVMEKVQTGWHWENSTFRTEKQWNLALHYQVCSMISDLHTFNMRPRYVNLELVPRITAEKALENFLHEKGRGGRTLKSLPDLLDRQTGLILDITVTSHHNLDDAYATKKAHVDEILDVVLFSLRGESHSMNTEFIDEMQIQACSEMIVSFANWLQPITSIEEYAKRVSNTDEVIYKFPKQLEVFISEHSDLGLCPRVAPREPNEEELSKRAQSWTQMTHLPRFELNPGKEEAEWRGYLKMADSTFVEMNYCDDYTAAENMFEDYEIEGPTDRVNLFKRSVQELSSRSIFQEVADGEGNLFGVGKKQQKRGIEDEDYKPVNYEIPKRSYPT